MTVFLDGGMKRSDANTFRAFPEWIEGSGGSYSFFRIEAGIYSDAGSNTCGSIWDKDMNGIGSGLYGHEFQDATLYFKEWGFDFIKIDYCGAGQELNLEEEKRYTEIRQAIDNLGCGHVLLISVDGLSRVLGLETLLVHGESVRISARSGDQ